MTMKLTYMYEGWGEKNFLRSDTDWTVQPLKMARGLKFLICEEEGLYVLWSENKGAYQLRGYSAADLHLHDAAHIILSRT